jgi:adenylosuccinate lyase
VIERYTLPEMGEIWSEQAKFQSWLDVEIAATEANCRLGRVPEEALETIKNKASFSLERILEIGKSKVITYNICQQYHN